MTMAKGSGDTSDLTELARRITALAGSGEQVEVYAARGRSTTVRAYEGEVESFKRGTSQGLGVRLVANGRQGFASAGTLDPDVAVETLAEARENASLAEPDEFVGLSEPDGVVAPDLVLLDPELHQLTDDQRVSYGLAVERAVLGRDPRVTGVRAAAFSDGWGEAAIVSTQGVDIWSDGGSCSVSVSPLAVDGDETQIGFAVDAARQPAALDIEAVGLEAIERAVEMIGAVKPESARLTAVLDKRVVASFMDIVAGTLSGDRVSRGRSPFAERLHETIGVPGLSLIDDGTDPESLSADVHDGEGLATRRNVLVDDGRLAMFLYHSASARRAATRSTGSALRGARSTPGVGVHSLSILPGDTGFDDLVSGVGEGVFIQRVNGLHSGVNSISGDLSVGVQGRMIRGGALAEPIREATIATTLQRLLLGINRIGSDVERLPGGTQSVSMSVDEISLSGT
ncbi:MAG: TldD/PmbA family protein [Actinobacteria bacterium]|nr:TldD/PmbA family protein [Actinomycetota bacterium]